MKTVIGMDLGDKSHFVVVLDEAGEQVLAKKIGATAPQLQKFFAPYAGAAVVMEAGTHSPWISRLLHSMGLEVCVANPRRMRAIWDAVDKCDERDARLLAKVYRVEPQLLHQVHHRSERAQADFQVLKTRRALVELRTSLINHVRGSVKSVGGRIPACSADCFHRKALDHLPEATRRFLQMALEQIEQLTAKIKVLDKEAARMCRERYPETELLMAIPGVGPMTALAFVLTIEDPGRFAKSRKVGAFLGLTPRRDQSGECDKQLGITKAGDGYVRQLLVSCAHYIMGRHGGDCDLRRHGERIAGRGGKNAKKRAVTAVARKLSILMHRLWRDGAVYEPLRCAA